MNTLVFIILASGMSFNPNVAHIAVNTRVTWINKDKGMPHNVVFKDFRSPMLFDGMAWSFTFDKPGVYDYYCQPHRTMGMVGRVIVD